MGYTKSENVRSTIPPAEKDVMFTFKGYSSISIISSAIFSSSFY